MINFILLKLIFYFDHRMQKSLFLVLIEVLIPYVIHGFEKCFNWRQEICLIGTCLFIILLYLLLLPFAIIDCQSI